MGDFFAKNRGTDKRRLIADDDVERVDTGSLPHMSPLGYGSVNNNGGELIVFVLYLVVPADTSEHH